MAASIYATPPPDLSGEDTALSDVSNSSQLSCSSDQSKSGILKTKRTIADLFSGNSNTKSSPTLLATNVLGGGDTNDQSKKRRKQSTPIRISALNLSKNLTQISDTNPIENDITIGGNYDNDDNAIKSENDETICDNGEITIKNIKLNNIENNLTNEIAIDKHISNEEIDVKQNKSNADENSIERFALTTIPTIATTATLTAATLTAAAVATTATATTPATIIEEMNEDYEDKLSKIFLPKLIGQFPNPFDILQTNISSMDNTSSYPTDVMKSLSSQDNLEQEEQSHKSEQDKTEHFSKSFKNVDVIIGENRHEETSGNPFRQCKECGECFDSDLKVSIHVLQEHTLAERLQRQQQHQHQQQQHHLHQQQQQSQHEYNSDIRDGQDSEPMDMMIHPTKIKTEVMHDSNSNPSSSSLMENNKSINDHLVKQDQWLASMPGLGFPFPPEAAAALSASSYLSQLPLLGVPSVGPYSSEGLSRPQLRIFNPEAFCDLCNKEFCNKYFLKTHKANKHGIYDPVTSSSDTGPTGNLLNPLNQAFQMQFQQQQQQIEQQQFQQQQQLPQPSLAQSVQTSVPVAQPQQSQQSQQQSQLHPTQQQQQQQTPQQQSPQQQHTIIPPGPAVFCDVCNKRFTNIFAMKRHRSKAHEIPPPSKSPLDTKPDLEHIISKTPPTVSQTLSATSSNEKENTERNQMPLRLPEGFREDFSVEQEDATFTPQPRKLSPSSQLLAREANFSFDKLKRLGVLNPEAFCDLCCKEYCNKYFLRTHKWKRHGVFVPSDDGKDENKLPWQFMGIQQTTPLNLMMANEKLQRQLFENTDSNAKRMKLEDGEIFPSKSSNGQEEIHKDGDRSSSGRQTESPQNNLPDGLTMAALGQTPEAVGLNIQKLQSMILQLNDLNGKRPIPCHICGREIENQYALHAHIATEHSNGGDNNNGSIGNNFNNKLSPSISPTTSGNQNEICKQCDREFPCMLELKQHIVECHNISLNSSPGRDGLITPERSINSSSIAGSTVGSANSSRPPYTITPTSSYCEICNKELCNKYFMKTHMQRMHGIEIENGAQIGGVVCNICNKELCSKYFLRVHKHNTHGIVEDGSPLPQPRQNGEPPEAEQQFPTENAKGEITELGTRYFTHYTEVCPLCSRRFRSAKWLRAHLMSDHGQIGLDKLRELEQQLSFNAKSSSPTLKIPNGGMSSLNNINANLLGKSPFPNIFMNDNTAAAAAAAVANSAGRFKDYQCSICSFSTPYYAFLFIHERSHSILNNSSSPPLPLSLPTPQVSESAISIAKDSQNIAQPSPTLITNNNNNINNNNNNNNNNSNNNNSNSNYNNNNNSSINNNNNNNNNNINHNSNNNIAVSSSSSASGTPTTTPTSTPIPQTPQETASSIIKHETPTTQQQQHQQQSSQLQQQHQQQLQQLQQLQQQQQQLFTSSSAQDTGLMEIANQANRPASYAFPKTFNGSEMMQSFFIEENHFGAQNMSSATTTSSHLNRFVPAVIYLPVKERISGPITVSFTLTPA